VGKFSAQHALGQVAQRVKKSTVQGKVASLVETYISTMESKKLSLEGVWQAKACLRRFSETFGKLEPQDIKPSEIESWFNSLPFSQRTIWNHYSQARQFYNWREVRTLVPASPFLDVETPEKTTVDVRRKIITPAQMKELLSQDLEPWTKCKIVLGGFAGLRVCEMMRMTYESIDEEFEEIIVTKEQSKQGRAMRPRSVTLQEAVKRHLPKGSGPLTGKTPAWSWRQWMPKKVHLGGVEVGPNALRHSFASYHLAHFKDMQKTAFEMGHTSPRLVYETYANSVSRRDAAEWWSL
jgi:integrase